MATVFRPLTLILFLGDAIFLVFSLWLALFLRSFAFPTESAFFAHLLPFSIIFAVSIITFVIAGLYETRSVILARRAFSITLLIAQTFNVLLAAGLFFFVPIFGIAPKTLLGVYLVVSFLCVLMWRVVLFPRFGLQKPEAAVVVGDTQEVHELVDALHKAHRAPARVAEVLSPESAALEQDIARAVVQHKARFIIADFNDVRVAHAFPGASNFLASGVRFFDALELYETVFGRIPLSLLNERWLAQNVSLHSRTVYDVLKRAFDIIAGLLLGTISLIFYPCIIVAIKLQDSGPIFYSTVRIGQNNRPFIMRKFRSMTGTDHGKDALKSRHVVTPVGRIIRKIHLDEIPQLWSVVVGDLSLIGPRPELPALVEEYTKQIPYYNLRHVVKPGLSGWALLYHDNDPHHATEVEATREKLSYDLYYLKHRSFMLDVVVALKTIKKLLTRSGV